MAPTQSKAASRKWLYYGIALTVVVVGVVLVYRALTGNTLRDQRRAHAVEKAEKELAAKSPGSAESFSALLERRAQEAQTDLEKERTAAALAEKSRADQEALANAAASRSAAGATTAGQGGAMPQGAPSPLPGLQGMGNRLGNALGVSANGPEANAEVDAYALRKDLQLRDSTRKMGSWERDAARTSTAQNEDASGLRPLDGMQKTAAPSLAAGISPALVDAYLKTQSPRAEPAGNEDKFLQQAARREVDAPLSVQSGPGPHSVMQGTPIPIAMRTAVSSDVSGPCAAQVVQDVYDSLTQSERLIPAGTKLICVYNAEVVQGQERLNLAFTRMIFSNGASVALAGMQGEDMEGVVGAPAQVNNRFLRTFGASFLVAALARAADSSTPSAGVTVNVSGALGNAGAQVLADIARQSLQRNLQIKPELRLNLGDRLNMVVTRDMVLDPAKTGVRQR